MFEQIKLTLYLINWLILCLNLLLHILSSIISGYTINHLSVLSTVIKYCINHLSATQKLDNIKYQCNVVVLKITIQYNVLVCTVQ